MGGGGGVGGILKDIGGAAMALPTGGASLMWGPDTRNVGKYTPGGAAVKNVGQPLYDVLSGKDARKAADQMAQALKAQQTQAQEAQRQMLQAPKNITPDNFLATKAKQLANLKLGIASTITGGGGGGAVLSSPTLYGSGPGKTRFGT